MVALNELCVQNIPTPPLPTPPPPTTFLFLLLLSFALALVITCFLAYFRISPTPRNRGDAVIGVKNISELS